MKPKEDSHRAFSSPRALRQRPLDLEAPLTVVYLHHPDGPQDAAGRPVEPSLVEFLKAEEAKLDKQIQTMKEMKKSQGPVAGVREVPGYDDAFAAAGAPGTRQQPINGMSACQPALHTGPYIKYDPSSSSLAAPPRRKHGSAPAAARPKAKAAARTRDAGVSRDTTYTLDEHDETWLAEVNKLAQYSTCRTIALPDASFELIIQRLELAHQQQLEQCFPAWKQHVQARLMPSVPDVQEVLPRPTAVKALSDTFSHRLVKQVYDYWVQRFKANKGPLLQHLWFEQPWKAMSFPDPLDPTLIGIMPFNPDTCTSADALVNQQQAQTPCPPADRSADVKLKTCHSIKQADSNKLSSSVPAKQSADKETGVKQGPRKRTQEKQRKTGSPDVECVVPEQQQPQQETQADDQGAAAQVHKVPVMEWRHHLLVQHLLRVARQAEGASKEASKATAVAQAGTAANKAAAAAKAAGIKSSQSSGAAGTGSGAASQTKAARQWGDQAVCQRHSSKIKVLGVKAQVKQHKPAKLKVVAVPSVLIQLPMHTAGVLHADISLSAHPPPSSRPAGLIKAPSHVKATSSKKAGSKQPVVVVGPAQATKVPKQLTRKGQAGNRGLSAGGGQQQAEAQHTQHAASNTSSKKRCAADVSVGGDAAHRSAGLPAASRPAKKQAVRRSGPPAAG